MQLNTIHYFWHEILYNSPASIYGADPNTTHLNTGNIQNLDMLLSGFQMVGQKIKSQSLDHLKTNQNGDHFEQNVQFSNGWAAVPTI